jgi:natural product biosynthesis luciferase-like monooxygenase protein
MDDVQKRIAALPPDKRELFARLAKEKGILPKDGPVVSNPVIERETVGSEQAHALVAPLTASPQENEGMEFSLFFFSSDEYELTGSKYRLVIEGAKFADEHGFTAVWTPERHFNRFGGLYPNPSVLSAAIAMVTKRLQIRAGSVVLPLHHPIRVAEEWSLVDNLSGGRVAAAFASGFHHNDFAFRPENYESREQAMYDAIETLRKLWQGEKVSVQSGDGSYFDVEIHPRPVQNELPVWIAASGRPQTFVRAGEIGANVLTALLSQSVEQLAERIALYRESLVRNGYDGQAGRVTVMLHTFIGGDLKEVKDTVRNPFCDYLRLHSELVKPLAKTFNIDIERFSERDQEAMFNFAFERYFNTSSLMGTPDSCQEIIRRLRAIGVNEIACLIDFGVAVESVMESLHYLKLLKDREAMAMSGATAQA